MADSVTSKVIVNGSRTYAVRLTNISDGTGESLVNKVDISALRLANGIAPTKVAVQEIQWAVQGFTSVRLYWDHTTDVLIDVLSGNGYRDYGPFGLLTDSGTGETGDVLLTTAGGASGSTYDITLVLVLS